MARNFICNECGGAMKHGFIVETRGNMGWPYDASYWQEGRPEKSFLGLRTSGKQQYYISAYRCERCGLLKIYAGPDLAANE